MPLRCLGSQGGDICVLCLLMKKKGHLQNRSVNTLTKKHLKLLKDKFHNIYFSARSGPARPASPSAVLQGVCPGLLTAHSAHCYCPSPELNWPNSCVKTTFLLHYSSSAVIYSGKPLIIYWVPPSMGLFFCNSSCLIKAFSWPPLLYMPPFVCSLCSKTFSVIVTHRVPFLSYSSSYNSSNLETHWNSSVKVTRVPILLNVMVSSWTSFDLMSEQHSTLWIIP